MPAVGADWRGRSGRGSGDAPGVGLLLRRISTPVSYTHLRAHETVLDLVCRLLLEKKKKLTHLISFLTVLNIRLTRTLRYLALHGT